MTKERSALPTNQAASEQPKFLGLHYIRCAGYESKSNEWVSPEKIKK